MSKRAPILLARKGAEVVFGLAIFAILARTLTKEQFAIYSLVFGFVAILRLTALPGLGSAISQAFARGLLGGFRRAVKLSLTGSLVGALIMFIGAGWHFYMGEEMVGQALLAAGVFFPFVVGLTFWRNAAMGLERYMRLLWFDGLSSALKFTGVVLSVYLFPGQLIPVVIAVFVAPSLLNVLVTIVQLGNRDTDSVGEQRSIEYGIRTTIYQLPSVLAQQLDKLVLFYFISPEAMAIYAAALRMPELARTVVGETNAVLGPVFAREKVYTRSIHLFSLKLWLLYGVVSVLGALFIVPHLLPILVGTGYMEAVPYAQFMVIGAALGYLGNIQFRYIRSHLHDRSFFVVTTTKAVFDCVLILGFVYYFGLAGVVASYVVKNLGYSVITNTVIRHKYLRAESSPRSVQRKSH